MSLLCFGVLTISASSKECELLLTPSDFQLEDELRAPNESNVFSAIGNMLYIANFRSFTQRILCGGLAVGDIEKTRSCLDEVNQFIEIDSAKSNGSRLSDIIGRNLTDGYKRSGSSPISQQHLCSIQNKYKTKESYPRTRLLSLLEKRQVKMRENYLEVSKTAGQSSKMDEIIDCFVQVERSNN